MFAEAHGASSPRSTPLGRSTLLAADILRKQEGDLIIIAPCRSCADFKVSSCHKTKDCSYLVWFSFVEICFVCSQIPKAQHYDALCAKIPNKFPPQAAHRLPFDSIRKVGLH